MQNKRLILSILGLVVGYFIAVPTVGLTEVPVKTVATRTVGSAATSQLKPEVYTTKQIADAAAEAIRTNSDAKFCSELLYNGNSKQALGYCVYWYYEAYKSGNQPEILAARSFYLMVLDNLMKQVDNNLLERY